jgi:hypothetical protein
MIGHTFSSLAGTAGLRYVAQFGILFCTVLLEFILYPVLLKIGVVEIFLEGTRQRYRSLRKMSHYPVAYIEYAKQEENK